MKYKEALAYIHSVDWKGCRPGLERITELCRLLGNPERGLRFIHVAGTNGKGSTSAMLDSILRCAGYRVGLFTSPYVSSFNERIRIDGREIGNDELARHTETVKAACGKIDDSPTEFEMITAIGFLAFLENRCDVVVLECGLGGRFDATNVIEGAALSVITGIDLDHTSLLGDTTEKIAWEKAGIVKPGTPVLFGEGDDGAEEVIRRTAEEAGSRFIRTDFASVTETRSDLNMTTFRWKGETFGIRLLGLYQLRNAATVLTAVELLRERGFRIPQRAAREGLRRAEWKARFEILSREPLVIYDGAHNPQGFRGAAENIRHYLAPLTPDGKILFLMGVMADKDYRTMTEGIAPFARAVFTVTPKNARSLDSSGLSAEFASHGIPSRSYATIARGVAAGIRAAERDRIPLLCLGSLYLYADVSRAAERILKKERGRET